MKRYWPRVFRHHSGMSVPEIMVAMAIFAIVLSSVAQMIRHTVRYYNTHVQATEIQQQAIQAAQWISQEMQEGSYRSVISAPAPSPHIIFGSPRDVDGKLSFEDEVMLWQKFVCYYVTSMKGESLLARGELAFEKPAKAAPPVPSAITMDSFLDPSARQRVMARHIESIGVEVLDSAEIEIKANLNDGAFTLTLKTSVEMGN